MSSPSAFDRNFSCPGLLARLILATALARRTSVGAGLRVRISNEGPNFRF